VGGIIDCGWSGYGICDIGLDMCGIGAIRGGPWGSKDGPRPAAAARNISSLVLLIKCVTSAQ